MKGKENSQQQLQAKEVVLVSACCTALATFPVVFYQTGLIPHLPDSPWLIFQSEQIGSSKTAHLIGMLGLASFSAHPARKEVSTFRRLLGVKLNVDAVTAAFNVGRQVVRSALYAFGAWERALPQHRWCGQDMI